MNGAAAVPERNTSRPSMTITTTIGSSHHFLLCFRKYQNSATKPVLCSTLATCSKSDMRCLLCPLVCQGSGPAHASGARRPLVCQGVRPGSTPAGPDALSFVRGSGPAYASGARPLRLPKVLLGIRGPGLGCPVRRDPRSSDHENVSADRLEDPRHRRKDRVEHHREHNT